MQNKKIDLIVGARPNFVKCAILYKELKNSGFSVRLIHTGQHYDKSMSGSFFEDLNIPKEDYNLNVGSSTHAKQTAKIMIEYEKLLLENKPDLVIVFGDVNSTIATVLSAAKLHVKTAHVEAGLRSFDKNMPEEINRIATDSITDYLFCPSEDAIENLKKEGHDNEKVFIAGNIMIDTLMAHQKEIDNYNIEEEFNIENNKYVFLTMHRPSNVDNKEKLKNIIDFLNTIAEKYTIIFPIHPRTEKNIHKFQLAEYLSKNIKIIKPVPYLKSIKFIKEAFCVITDSGGIQEESTFLGTRCYTLRENTERPVTISQGTNQLIKPTKENAEKIIREDYKRFYTEIKYWDGKTSQRIVNILKEVL